MRARVNHRKTVKQDWFEKKFWDEYKKRGFKIGPENDGCYHNEVKLATLTKKSSDNFEVVFDAKTKVNIVTAKMFMKTVAQIEGFVKYKLFK